MQPTLSSMETWKLKMTPADGPATEKRGLTREQAMWALTDLMYGTFDDVADEDVRQATPAPAPERLAA